MISIGEIMNQSTFFCLFLYCLILSIKYVFWDIAFVVLFVEFKANELVVKVRNNLSSLYDEYKLLYCDDVEVMEVVNDEKELEVDIEGDARMVFDSVYMIFQKARFL